MLAEPTWSTTVVPRKGDVDRNWACVQHLKRHAIVVPRKGDVDRNAYEVAFFEDHAHVVPRKGDVDRNYIFDDVAQGRNVVPRKGDVDRNKAAVFQPVVVERSSPARGTWIEIERGRVENGNITVVPRKGDVDRNL